MAGTLRMKLLPFPRPEPGRTHQVEGVRVSLLKKGKGATSAQVGQQVPATLEFYCLAFTGADSSGVSPEKFATLDGNLELVGASKQPLFVNAPDGEGLPGTFQYTDPLTPEVRAADRLRPKRISIRVDFDPASFAAMEDIHFSNSFLVLPELPAGTLFVEIDTKIVVAGAVEAETEVSDRLDGVLFGPVGSLVPPTSFGFQLTDAGGRPPNMAVKFRVSDPDANIHEGETNAQGQGFVDGIRPGPCDLELPDVPYSDWGADPKPGAASSNHTASGDEDLPEIVAKLGFRDPIPVYQFGENEQLVKDRPNMNQLAKDDAIKIPAKDAEPKRLDAGQLHAIQLAARPVERLRIQLNVEGVFRYELMVGTSPFRGSGEGPTLIEHEVPVVAKTGHLKIKLGESPPFRELEWDVKMAAIEPVITDRGLQARLSNLGFDPQGVDGKIGKKTKAAITAFQRFVELEPTGEADEATRTELERRHDQLTSHAGG